VNGVHLLDGRKSSRLLKKNRPKDRQAVRSVISSAHGGRGARTQEFSQHDVEPDLVQIPPDSGCGCGSEVVTPLSPAAWSLLFDGVSVSLHPSVGNWNLPCQSHYIIRRNQVLWAKKWSQRQIAAGRARDRARAAAYFKAGATPQATQEKQGKKSRDDEE